MEDKEYEYKRLNIKNGDIINDYHINYLQDAISKISSESKDFKNNLANILKAKGIEASNKNTFEELLSKVNSLQNSPERTHEEEWPDISETIESGHIRLLVQTGIELVFSLKPSKPATFVINWGDGSTERVYIAAADQTIKKTISNIGLVIIDISLDTEDCRIEEWKSNNGTSRNSILWFCSKDIFFTNGYGMFNANNGTAPCENLKYIDFIGGGVNGDITYFAKGCLKLERVTGDLNPNGYNAIRAFDGCKKLKQLPILNLNGVKNVDCLFLDCQSITDFPYYINNNGSITSAISMFQNCTSLTKFVANQEFNFSNADNQNQCFQNCTSLVTSPKIKFGSGNAYNFFYNCTSLRNLNQDTFDLNAATNISGFFQNCSSLIDGPSAFYASKATTITNLFGGCSNIKQVPDSLTFPMATTAAYLFKDCFSLKTAPTIINLPLATDIRDMFRSCSNLTTPPATINAEKAKIASELFRDCFMLTKTPTTIKLTIAKDIYSMFYNCTSLTTGPDMLEAPVAVNASNFFYNCKLLTDAGRSFEIGNNNPGGCNLGGFFQYCSSLKTVPREGNMHNGSNYFSFFHSVGDINYESLQSFCGLGLDFPLASSLNTFFQSSTIKKIPSIKAPNCTDIQQAFQYTSTLNYIGDLYLPLCRNMYALFNSSGNSLLEIGKINVTSNPNNNPEFNNLRNIKKLTLVGLRTDFTLNSASNLTAIELEEPNADFIGNLQFNGCKLSVDALNSLLDSLPNVTSRSNKPSIQIKNNPGSSNCNTLTAKANGWNVITQ